MLTARVATRAPASVVAGLLGGLLAGAAAAAPPPAPRILLYHESWAEPPAARAADLGLARLPAEADTVALAFARPDAAYAGDLSGQLRGSGLEYSVPGWMLREAVGLLRQRNPGQRVLLSVGGATYTNWAGLNAPAIAALVRDLGLDGVDIDLESPRPGCARDAAGRLGCATDALWRDSIRRLRAALPRPMFISITGWSVGAYGTGRWQEARPTSPWTGAMTNLLRAPEAAMVDLLSIMAYDAGPEFDPAEAFAAYRALWPGPLLLGQALEPTPPLPTTELLRQTGRFAAIAAADPAGGMMLFGWRGSPPAAAAPATAALRLACRALRPRCAPPPPSRTTTGRLAAAPGGPP
jgi:hypothetical protein